MNRISEEECQNALKLAYELHSDKLRERTRQGVVNILSQNGTVWENWREVCKYLSNKWKHSLPVTELVFLLKEVEEIYSRDMAYQIYVHMVKVYDWEEERTSMHTGASFMNYQQASEYLHLLRMHAKVFKNKQDSYERRCKNALEKIYTFMQGVSTYASEQLEKTMRDCGLLDHLHTLERDFWKSCMQIQDAITQWSLELGYDRNLVLALIDNYKRDSASRIES